MQLIGMKQAQQTTKTTVILCLTVQLSPCLTYIKQHQTDSGQETQSLPLRFRWIRIRNLLFLPSTDSVVKKGKLPGTGIILYIIS